MFAGKSIKLLGVVGFLLFTIVFTYMMNILVMSSVDLLSKSYNVPRGEIEKTLLKALPVIDVISVIALFISWCIHAGILHGFLKAFKINSRYSSTFLIAGHNYYLSAVSIALTYWTLLTNSNYMKVMLIYKTMPIEVYIYGVLLTVVLAGVYVAFLLSREYNVSVKKVLIATLITNAILYVIGQIAFVYRS